MEIANKFKELQSSCIVLKKYDKSFFNKGVDDVSISKWEQAHSLTIPQNLKFLLSISNGFKVLGRTAEVFRLEDIGYNFPDVPKEYIVFGKIVGDGEKLCFHEQTEEIVTIYNGEIKKCSIICLLDYCIDQCLDGIFMSDANVSGLSQEIQSIVQRYRMKFSVKINALIELFRQLSLHEKEQMLFDCPVLIRAILFNALENAECTTIIDYIHEHDAFKADNLLRGMRRRAIDNFFNREKSLLDNGKTTYPWNVNQMRELYNFDEEGMSYQNAGEVNKYDMMGNPILIPVQGRNGDMKMITSKVEIAYMNDISLNPRLVGNPNNITVKG